MSETSRLGRRRRGKGFVVANACTACKQKRSRCSGEVPCGQCLTDSATCQYKVPEQIAKSKLKADIQELQSYRRLSDYVFTTLASRDRLDFIMQQLRDSVTVETILRSLQEHPAVVATDVGGPLYTNNFPRIPQEGSSSGNSSSSMEYEEIKQHINDRKPWTVITSDDSFIENLLMLYFCWEYPIFATFSKRYFLIDYREGRQRYCSSLLVNAVLAIGCQFLGKVKVLGTLYTQASRQEFFSKAERLLDIEGETPSLTTVQALGMLSIFAASVGRQSQAIFYSGQSIRIAIDIGLHLGVNEKHMSKTKGEVRSATV